MHTLEVYIILRAVFVLSEFNAKCKRRRKTVNCELKCERNETLLMNRPRKISIKENRALLCMALNKTTNHDEGKRGHGKVRVISENN